MKKLLLAIITLSIITFTGCYDPDTATVRINLGNIPIAKHEPKSFIDRVLGLFVKEAWADPLEIVDSGIVKVHVAALSGQSVLATASLDASEIEAYNIGVVSAVWVSYLDLEVPAGNNITILVVAESYNANNDTYYASYYGYNMVDLKPGETAEVHVSVYDNTETHGNFPSWNTRLAFTYHSLSESLSWNNIGFKVKYHVYANIGGAPNSLLYSGYDTSKSNIPYYPDYLIYLEFEPFSLKTDSFLSTLIQD